jgi:hypothetical protein
MLISRIAALLGGAGSSFGVLGGLLESPPLTHYDSTRRPCHLPQRQSPLLPAMASTPTLTTPDYGPGMGHTGLPSHARRMVSTRNLIDANTAAPQARRRSLLRSPLLSQVCSLLELGGFHGLVVSTLEVRTVPIPSSHHCSS